MEPRIHAYDTKARGEVMLVCGESFAAFQHEKGPLRRPFLFSVGSANPFLEEARWTHMTRNAQGQRQSFKAPSKSGCLQMNPDCSKRLGETR